MSLRIFLSYQYLGLHPHFKMQDKKKPKPMTLAEYANSLISDMKTLSNTLKPLSKNLYENNNRILNQVLTGKQQELHKMIQLVLSHTLQVAQYKPLVSSVLAILTKTIICLKTLPMDQSQSHSSSISGMISSLVDNLVAVANQNREVQELSLRVLQITFSLIDHNLVHNFNYSICTRIFSICFEFCTGISIVQNISVSALFALLEAVFQFGVVKESFLVLGDLLMYLFESKKFLWAKGKQMKGLIWDLVVIGVKNFTPNHIIALQSHPECLNLLKKMYEVVTETIFTKKSKQFYSPIPTPQRATSMPITSDIVDFTRFFKAYVSLSISLSMEAYRIIDKEFVPFRSTIPKLGIVCDLERNSRMYIFLEAICQLLLNQYDLPLSLEKGIIFMEILSKISEELCWCNETGVKVNWEHGENYLDKHVHEDPKISDGDFVRLIKNTIFQMRMKFQKDQDLITAKKNGKTMETSRSAVLPENLGNSKKWQSFMKNVVRIVRYLSSLNYIIEQSEQDPTRKILLELQYWFLLCPVSKAKNMVLQQLLITANVLNNRMQAVKVSQSVQIGSNILYGYYDDLDSMGLTIVLKMMAGIKADWEEGKSFQELDEIYNLVNNIYNEHHLIAGEASFLMTIQALVQCTNSLIADIEQPKDKQPNSQGLTHPIKRFHKMIQFLLQKLILVINNHLSLAAMQWNFITGFLITLCICKNSKIKEDGVKAIGALVTQLLKTELGKEIDEKKETDIMGLYEELAKSKMQKIMELTIIDQLKLIMPRIQQQVALMDCFRIVKILSDAQNKNPDVIASIHELQEILVKDCLFRITDLKYLRLIVDGMQIKVSEKNQEYRLINLLWAISDYFRSITPKDNIPNEYIELWEALFKNIWSICETSQQFQTKQSAIHCTTQILAEVLNQLPFDFIMLIISKYYHEMVLLLLGIHDSSLQESEKSSETAKVGLKNYIKLFKKLISIGEKSEQSKKQIQKNFSSINISIIKYLNHTVESQKTGPITLELLFELCNFILIVSEDVGFQEYGVTSAMRDMFMAIDDIIKLTQRNSESGILNPKMDLKSHMFKKKLKPLLDKISDRQKKEKVVLTEISNKLES